MTDLLKLTLEYNSPGGFDGYHNKFKTCCDKLLEANQPLTDKQKQTFFLNGIKDTSYAAKKDDVSDYSFYKTVLALRTKATELGRLTSGSAKSRNVRNQTRCGRNKGNKDNSKNDNNEKKGHRLPNEVWDKMSKENKKYWLDAQKVMKQNSEYGTHYSQNTEDRGTRKLNKSSRNDERPK